MAISAEPLYASIKTHIVGAISRGDYKVNDKLPSENELVEEFGVSRMTVNRALKELKDEGVITRVAGVGSFVAEVAPIGHFVQVRNIADEIRGRGHPHTARVIRNAQERAKKRAASMLGVALDTPIFHSVIVHNEAGRPLQLEDRLVLASAVPEYGNQDFTKQTPNQYLTRVAPLQAFEHKVRAVGADDRLKELLDLEDGEPCLLLTRRTWSAGQVVSFAQLYHPGSRFEFSYIYPPD